MKLPLFVHISPAPSDSALVLLGAGTYKIVTDKKDSVLNLSVEGNLILDIKDGDSIVVASKTPARASIVKAGTEPHISLYLDDLAPHA